MKNIGMERHIIRGVACTSAFLALIGTGFGAWVFAKTPEENVLRTPVELAAAIDFAEFKVTVNSSLFIDETGSSFSDCSIDVSTTVEIAQGVIMQENSTKDGYEAIDKKIREIDLHYDITCEMDSTLNKYIYCKTVSGQTRVSTSEDEESTDAKPKFRVVSAKEDTSESHDGLEGTSVIDGKLPIVFAWQPNMHPKSTTQFSEMVDTLSDVSEKPVTFTVKLNGADSTIAYWD